MSASGVRSACQNAQTDGVVSYGDAEAILQAARSGNNVITKGELAAARSELSAYRADVAAVTGYSTPASLREAAAACADTDPRRANELNAVASSLENFEGAVGKMSAQRGRQSRITNWWNDE